MTAQIGQYALILAMVVALAQILAALTAAALRIEPGKGLARAGMVLQLLFAALAVTCLLMIRPAAPGGGESLAAWIALTLLTVVAAVTLTVPLVRWLGVARREEAGPVEPTAPRAGAEHLVLPIALGLALIVAIAGGGLYAVLSRPPEVPNLAATGSGDHPGGDVGASIAQLESHLQAAPGDGEGWATLGWSYMRVARYDEAVAAYQHAVSLLPGQADLLGQQGQALMAQAGGKVTPQAKTIFQQALAIDPADPAARYFLALAKDQSGDAKGAMDAWIALIASAPPGAAWEPEIRARVEATARERSVDIATRLPREAASAPPVALPGPTADQVAQASRLPPDQQQSMVAGMVESLAARLKNNPRDADGWTMLLRSRMNLGQTAQAQADLAAALAAFSDAPDVQARLRQTGRTLGIPGA